jgi:RNA polymerase sigma factor (sigma-70 family)
VLRVGTPIDPSGLGAYASVAGRNAAFDMLRARTSMPRIMSLSTRGASRKAQNIQEPKANYKFELLGRVEKAMEKLGKSEREVILINLRFNWDHIAAGAHLGLVPNTYSQRFCRAIKRLRELCLREE